MSEQHPTGRRQLAWSALLGVVAGALTVGVAELVAALLERAGRAGGTPSPVIALGGAFIDRTPPWLKDLAVSTFGTHDKTALLTGIAVVVVLLAALAGVLAARHRLAGLFVVVVLAAVAGAAVLSRPHASSLDVVPTVLGAIAGLALLTRLLDRWERAEGEHAAPIDAAFDRRSFLSVLIGSSAIAVLAGAGSQLVAHAARAVQSSRAALQLPAATGAGPTAQELGDLGLDGLSAFVTPPEQFYRIDTALSVPQVEPGTWRLRIHGMVEQELEITFDDLLALPMVDRLTTLTCVSNEVGGDLVGNQVWRGHLLRELLARVRPTSGADMVLSTSADGWTAGTPLEALTDPDRDALLAVAMGGQPLPVEHGFPVRMVVPGLYGYVSATKWVVDLEVTRFDQAEGYWTPRGWSARGPVKTESRIDVPRDGSKVAAGKVAVAGVAWAQHRGVEAVEVRVDEGPWQPARLGDGGTIDTWKQWVFEWEAPRGDHTLQVRATDRTGAAQTGEQAPPAPDGATGWHTVDVSVT
ncbi:molybdopterin-dependent oxidoreductase [Angustibacter peucedani]